MGGERGDVVELWELDGWNELDEGSLMPLSEFRAHHFWPFPMTLVSFALRPLNFLSVCVDPQTVYAGRVVKIV